MLGNDGSSGNEGENVEIDVTAVSRNDFALSSRFIARKIKKKKEWEDMTWADRAPTRQRVGLAHENKCIFSKKESGTNYL